MSFISIIIPTRNRCDLLGKAVRASISLAETDGNAEVIVVDNGSTDGTKLLCDDQQRESKVFRCIFDAHLGLHVGRHAGMRAAKGDILLYGDDDIEPFPTWLSAIREAFVDSTVGLVGGKCLPKFETHPPDWLSAMWSPNTQGERILGSLSLIDLGDKNKEISPYHVYGCNFAIRRTVLLEAGGFHPDAFPQEWIRYRGDGESHVSRFVMSSKYKAMYNPLASIYHYVPNERMTVDYFCRRAYNQGVSDSYANIRRNKGPMGSIYQRIRNKPLLDIPAALFNEAKKLIVRQRQPAQPPGNQGITELNLKVAAAYKEGYAYHQEQVRHAPDLLAWVLREDYWNCHMPSSSAASSCSVRI